MAAQRLPVGTHPMSEPTMARGVDRGEGLRPSVANAGTCGSIRDTTWPFPPHAVWHLREMLELLASMPTLGLPGREPGTASM